MPGCGLPQRSWPLPPAAKPQRIWKRIASRESAWAAPFMRLSLGLFGFMIAKKNPPKFSVIAAVLEALLSYMFLR